MEKNVGKQNVSKIYDEQTISNNKIAKLTDIEQKNIYRIDKYQRMDIRYVFPIADVLGMSPGELIKKVIARWDRKNAENGEYVGRYMGRYLSKKTRNKNMRRK